MAGRLIHAALITAIVLIAVVSFCRVFGINVGTTQAAQYGAQDFRRH
jgi:hypothetical protein